MDEYINRTSILAEIDAAEKKLGMGAVIADTLRRYLKRHPAAEVVPFSAYKQAVWERDLAIQQLREAYGVGLGESIQHCKRFKGVQNMAEWISVKERLPEKDSEAWYNLALTRERAGQRGPARVVRVGYWNGYHKRFWGFDAPNSYTVTHWMPLPEPPEANP